MKINELIQTGTQTEEYGVIIPAVLDDEGNVVVEAHTEIRTREVPVMECVTREMTAEEIAEMQADKPVETEPSSEERITQLESALIELAGIIGGAE